jgi:ribosome-associated protein
MKKKAATPKKSAAAKLSLQQILIGALEDLKAQNIVILDVTKLTDVTDKLIIASGTSTRQVRAIAENAMEEAKKKGFPAMGVEGLDAGDWVLADFVDIVVHVMLPETREFYDLERLWQSPDVDAVAMVAEVKKSVPERKADYKKSETKKSASKRVHIEDAPVFDSQHATAKARKIVGKPVPAARKGTAAKATPEKTGVAKAGVYAKAGIRKPAAAKAAVSASAAGKKKTAPASKTNSTKSAANTTPKKPASKKPAASKTTRSAIGISSTASKNKSNTPKKPVARKPRKT